MNQHRPSGRFSSEELAQRRLTRKKCINGVSESLLAARKRKESRDKSFLCESDLRHIWFDSDRLLEDVFFDSNLTRAHYDAIKHDFLPFLSFLVWIEVPDDWYAGFQSRIFNNSNPAGFKHSFKLPQPRRKVIDLLKSIGIAPGKAERSWEDQFIFAPETIDFAPRLGPQVVTDSRHRLPFEQQADSGLTEKGGYGVVQYYRISPEYVKYQPYNKMPFHPKEPYAVAVKSFRSKDGSTSDAENEVKTLCLLKNMLTINNTPLSIHHAIIKHETECLIIFPLADLGNLEQFLQCKDAVADRGHSFSREPFKGRFPTAAEVNIDLAPALLKQCVGVAEAIRFLHGGFDIDEKAARYELAHMDLKPDNIIISSGKSNDIVGIWKLADFGISVVKEVTSVQGQAEQHRTMNITAKRPASTYNAPEIEQGYKDPDIIKVGRKSDIWSFGAIFSEVLTFAQKRSKGVEEFACKREKQAADGAWWNRFYSLRDEERPERLQIPTRAGRTQKFDISIEVSDWLDELCMGASTPHSYVDCWTKCIRSLLIGDPHARPDAEKLLRFVKHVSDHTYGARQPNMFCIFDTTSASSSDQPLQRTPPRSNSATLSQPSPISSSALNTAPPMDPVLQPESSAAPQILRTAATFPQAEDEELTNIPDAARRDLSSSHVSACERTVARDEDFHEPDVLHTTGMDAPMNSRSLTATDRSRQESITSSSTNSVDFGRPMHAHGILCSQDVQRSIKDHQTWEVTGPVSHATAVSLDRRHIAFLVGTKAKIHLFRINPSASGPAIADYALALDLGNVSSRWTGVSIAESVVAAWGYMKDSHKSVLRIFTLPSDASSLNYHGVLLPVDTALDSFDYNKRVTASSQGFVAMINGKQICIITTNAPVKVFNRQVPTTHIADIMFTDLSFNESGSILYCWAVDMTSRSGILLAFRMSKLADGRPDSIGYYRYDTDEEPHSTEVIPYNNYLGCIVAAPPNGLFFPGVIVGSSIDRTRQLPRHASTELKGSNNGVAVMYNDHSLIVAQKSSWHHYRLKEHPLTFRDNPVWGSSAELCKLSIRPKDSSQIKATRYGNFILILVCHLDGKVESIRFDPQ